MSIPWLSTTYLRICVHSTHRCSHHLMLHVMLSQHMQTYVHLYTRMRLKAMILDVFLVLTQVRSHSNFCWFPFETPPRIKQKPLADFDRVEGFSPMERWLGIASPGSFGDRKLEAWSSLPVSWDVSWPAILSVIKMRSGLKQVGFLWFPSKHQKEGPPFWEIRRLVHQRTRTPRPPKMPKGRRDVWCCAS